MLNRSIFSTNKWLEFECKWRKTCKSQNMNILAFHLAAICIWALILSDPEKQNCMDVYTWVLIASITYKVFAVFLSLFYSWIGKAYTDLLNSVKWFKVQILIKKKNPKSSWVLILLATLVNDYYYCSLFWTEKKCTTVWRTEQKCGCFLFFLIIYRKQG